MQEGVLSLMQMAKVSAVLAQLAERRIPYISILTNPTTGGVSASYAMLGDAIIAEPGAVIGFAGPRVIKQTLGQDLPQGFQTRMSAPVCRQPRSSRQLRIICAIPLDAWRWWRLRMTITARWRWRCVIACSSAG